jgi:hypothetical protein
MTYFLTQASELLRVPSLDNRTAQRYADIEASQLFVEAEQRLNSELAAMTDTPTEANPRELNDIKNKRRRREDLLESLQSKLKELQCAAETVSSDTVTLARIESLEVDIEEAARQTTEVVEDCTRYAYVRERTECMLKERKQHGRLLEDQVRQVTWRLTQAERLFKENDLAANALCDKMQSFLHLSEKARVKRVSKLKRRLSVAEDMRTSLECAKKAQIERMMPSKEQIAQQKKLEYKMTHVTQMKNSIVQAKVARE